MSEELYDALASLIQKIFVDEYAERIHTVVLTASNAESGVSYLASCMATILAQTLGMTLLVDGPVLPRLAQSGQLARRLDCTHVDGGHLWHLGTAEVNRMDMVVQSSSHHLRPVLGSLAQEFDYVVVDTPSLAISGLAEALAPIVDGTVLVAVKDRTTVLDLETARLKLTGQGGMLLGSIYNIPAKHSRTGEIR